jgi:hypothetical protein
MVFLAMLTLLVLVASANVANLRLVDNESRRRETGNPAGIGRRKGCAGEMPLKALKKDTVIVKKRATIAKGSPERLKWSDESAMSIGH